MPARHAHPLDSSTCRTVILLLLFNLATAAKANDGEAPFALKNDPPARSAAPLSLSPRSELNDPIINPPNNPYYLAPGSFYGPNGVINQGIIWGTGTFLSAVENHNLLITSETDPKDAPEHFIEPKQNIRQIHGSALPPWLKYGRVDAVATQTVRGDYRQTDEGSLLFKVTPTGNSRLLVEGPFLRIEGALKLDLEHFDAAHKGPLRPTYTLIETTQPDARLDPASLAVQIANDNPNWGYRITETDKGQVFLTMDPLRYFRQQAQTLNQRFLATILDHEVSKASGALYNALNRLYQLPQNQLRDTLTRIDGELHAETPGVLYSAVADAWNPVYARMGMSASQGGYVAGDEPHFWASGLGSFGGVDGNLNATGYRQQSAGSLVGADTQILDLIRVGLTAGYLSAGASRSGIDDHLSANLWQIGGYADLPFGTNGHFGLLVGYDQGQTSTRNTSLLGTSTSSGDARLITAEAIASWHHDLGGGHSLTPIIALQSLTTQHSGVMESGLSALNASTGSFSSNFVSARVQARYDYQWHALEADWTSSLAIGFREMLNQPLADREIHYIGTTDGDFLVEGAQSNGKTGAGLINAGLTGHLSNQFDLELGYRGIYTGTSRLSSFQGNLVWNYDAPEIQGVKDDEAVKPSLENPNAVAGEASPLTIRDPGADMANYPNSAFTLPEGGFYLESTPFGFTGESTGSGPQTESGQVLLRYGLVDNIELRLFYTPYEVQRHRTGSEAGSGPLAFDTKIHLWDAWEEYFIPAAGFELTITTPWLSSTAFQSSTSPGFSFNFDQDLPFDIGLEYNFGATDYPNPGGLSQSEWQFASQWAAQRDITEDVAIFFNGYYNRTSLPRVTHHHKEISKDQPQVICSESNPQDGHTHCKTVDRIINVATTVLVPSDVDPSVPVVLGGGLIWTLDDHIQLFGNAAAGVTQGSPGLQTYIGFAWTP
jgi:hypothetical protein